MLTLLLKGLKLRKIKRRKGGMGLKHGMKPTLKEKKLIQREGHKPRDFLRIKRDTKQYEFLQKYTGKILTIGRD